MNPSRAIFRSKTSATTPRKNTSSSEVLGGSTRLRSCLKVVRMCTSSPPTKTCQQSITSRTHSDRSGRVTLPSFRRSLYPHHPSYQRRLPIAVSVGRRNGLDLKTSNASSEARTSDADWMQQVTRSKRNHQPAGSSCTPSARTTDCADDDLTQ